MHYKILFVCCKPASSYHSRKAVRFPQRLGVDESPLNTVLGVVRLRLSASRPKKNTDTFAPSNRPKEIDSKRVRLILARS
jgi:hypothetical protein